MRETNDEYRRLLLLAYRWDVWFDAGTGLSESAWGEECADEEEDWHLEMKDGPLTFDDLLFEVLTRCCKSLTVHNCFPKQKGA